MSQQQQHELGDAPIEEAYAEKMKAVAFAIDEFFNGGARGDERTTGFVLLVFPFGDRPGRCNYISNGSDRKDIAQMFRDQAARLEAADALPSCPTCGETATYQTPNGAYWCSNAHHWRAPKAEA